MRQLWVGALKFFRMFDTTSLHCKDFAQTFKFRRVDVAKHLILYPVSFQSALHTVQQARVLRQHHLILALLPLLSDKFDQVECSQAV